MWGRRSLRAPLAEPLTSGQRRLREPKMATAPCSIDVFEQLDDAARVEAYRSAVSEAGALKTEVDQLQRELEGFKTTATSWPAAAGKSGLLLQPTCSTCRTHRALGVENA